MPAAPYLRPLSPNTQAQYDQIVARGFGNLAVPVPAQDLKDWPRSVKHLLKAAVKRKCAEVGAPPEARDSILAMIPESPPLFRIRRASPVLSEVEASAYEAAAMDLPPARRALALLPLATGLRAMELLQLKRDDVQRAVKTSDLIALRKGGMEQVLHLPNATQFLADLLPAPKARGKWSASRGVGRPEAWQTAGEILSPASRQTQYHLLHRLILSVGVKAGVKGVRPHLLRHAFATRMLRAGAPESVIQKMLNHSKLETTSRYLHLDTADAERFLKRY